MLRLFVARPGEGMHLTTLPDAYLRNDVGRGAKAVKPDPFPLARFLQRTPSDEPGAQQGREVYAFTRPGDREAQHFASDLGAVWAGGSDEAPAVALDAAIIFAPVGALVPAALSAVRKGGRVVCGGIHMTDIPAMPYRLLWGERELVSVANLTRKDAEEFFPVAREAGVRTHTRRYPLERANEALADLREGRLSGAAVLVP
jgi:propanol-preferring alcohol dehydrogenase